MAVQLNFRVRIYKKVAGTPDSEEWSNEYDLRTPAPVEVTDASLALCVNDLFTFEKRIHTLAVEFKRAVISTQFEENSNPQDNSRTIGLTGLGARTDNININKPLSLDNVLIINFNGTSGRASRHQYRGALDELTSPSTIFGIEIGGGTRQVIKDQIDVLANSATGQMLQIANIKDDVIESRPVTSISVGGVSTRQRKSRRKPKISHDEDAMRSRLVALTRELALINASLAVKLALGGFDVTKAAALQLAFDAAKAEAQKLSLGA